VKRGDPTASAEITNYTLMLRHLHLRDAYFTAPGQKSISLGHTRVLLTQVAAWSVGARTVSRA
jgi:hypothetical protein